MEMTIGLADKIRRGDSLSDQELDVALHFYRQLMDSLFLLRPQFDLAWYEAQRIHSKLDSYKMFRQRDI